jgi:transposase
VAATYSQANLPQGVVWRPLPTACPGINPCENLFQELRKPLANRVFASKEEVQECLLHQLSRLCCQISHLMSDFMAF